MNAYILFLETWKLELRSNKVRLRLITYFYAGEESEEGGHDEKRFKTHRGRMGS
jgi:hypothetical protein